MNLLLCLNESGVGFLLVGVIVAIVVILMNRPQGMGKHEAADLFSLFDPVFNGKAEVNSRIDPGFAILRGCLGKAYKRPGQAWKWGAACSRKRYIVGMEESAQYSRSSAARDAMRGCVIGNRRRIEQ